MNAFHQGSTWYRYVLYIATFFKDVDSFAKMVTNKDSLVYQTDLTQLSCLSNTYDMRFGAINYCTSKHVLIHNMYDCTMGACLLP